MSDTFQGAQLPSVQPLGFTANLAQAAGTYTLCTATNGDILVMNAFLGIYVSTVGATFTSVSIQTSQTNNTVILSAIEGALGNLIAQKNLIRAVPIVPGIVLKSGQTLTYTIVGLTGTGSLFVAIPFMAITPGAVLA